MTDAELSAAVQREVPALAAPDDLRDAVTQTLRAAAHKTRPRLLPAMRAEWLAAAAVVLAAAGSTWQLGVMHGRAMDGAAAGLAMRDAVVDSHVRSLQATHLLDVPSSDRHTVKPWFNGKLDFSPPVLDLSASGFPLLGGRLDYLEGRPVAALVCGRARHIINVFVWPTTSSGRSMPASPPDEHGYHVRHWESGEMTYWAVSDLAPADLDALVALLSSNPG